MASPKYFVLLASTVLFGLIVEQSEAVLVGANIGKVDGAGNIVISLAEKGVKELESTASQYSKAGPIGEAIEILESGWSDTVKLLAKAFAGAFDLIDNILDKKIIDKDAALNALTKGIDTVANNIYHAGAVVHASLGSAQSVAKFAEKGALRAAIHTIQDCGTTVFESLEVAKYFAIQGLKSDDDEVKEKCRIAAATVLKAAANTANDYIIAGGKNAIKYLAESDKASIVKAETIQNIISNKAMQAAAADSDTVAAIAALNTDFEDASKNGVSADILKIVKDGLLEYIDHSAWSIAISYDAIAEAKILAKLDPETAIRSVRNAIENANSVLIYGIVKAYEALGIAGRLSGEMNAFEKAIEFVEKSRVEGTKGMGIAEKIAITAIKTGGPELEETLESARIALEAVEAVIFDLLHETINVALKCLKP